MVRSISELEKKLGDIEGKVSDVKKIIDKQDTAIKVEVKKIQSETFEQINDSLILSLIHI